MLHKQKKATENSLPTPKVTIPATGHNRDQETDQAKNGLAKIGLAKIGKQELNSLTSTSFGTKMDWPKLADHSNDELRLRKMDIGSKLDMAKESAFNRPSAKCSASSYQQKENTRKRHRTKMKKKVKEEVGKPEKVEGGEKEKENHGSSEDQTDDGNSLSTDCDQDSDISFMNDTDEEIDTAETQMKPWNG